jgi:hypothetical protein
MVLAPLTGAAMMATAVTACPAPAKLPAPPPNRPIYAMSISIGAGKKIVNGSLRVSFTLDRASVAIPHRTRKDVSTGTSEEPYALVMGSRFASHEPEATRLRRWRPVCREVRGVRANYRRRRRRREY